MLAKAGVAAAIIMAIVVTIIFFIRPPDAPSLEHSPSNPVL
jgi:hypothetical protein